MYMFEMASDLSNRIGSIFYLMQPDIDYAAVWADLLEIINIE